MGAKRRLNGTSKSEQTHRQTDIWTFRLIESIGPEGQCFENLITQQLVEEKSIPTGLAVRQKCCRPLQMLES